MVDNATIFLMSYSTVAQILEPINVNVLLRRRVLFKVSIDEMKG